MFRSLTGSLHLNHVRLRLTSFQRLLFAPSLVAYIEKGAKKSGEWFVGAITSIGCAKLKACAH